MTTLTAEEKAARELKAARLLEQMEAFLDGDGGFKAFEDRVKAVETSIEGFKGIDPNEVSNKLEQLKATQQKLADSIRRSKAGLYIPGIEDENFSILKGLVGARTGIWRGAEKEKEIMELAREKAAQIAGDQVTGRYFIPDQVIADLIGPIYTKSVFINLGTDLGETRVSVLDGLVGGSVKVPKFDGGLIAYWMGEEDEYIESMTKVGDMNLKPHKLGVLVRITDTMRKFAGYGYENLLRTDMIRAMAKKIDWTIAYGTGGDNMPLGIVNHPLVKLFLMLAANSDVSADNGPLRMFPNLQYILDHGITATGAEISFDALEEMDLAMEEDDITLDNGATRISAKRLFSRLKRAKIDNYSGQTTDQAYMLGAPFIPDARLRDIIGDFGWSNQITSNHSAGAGIVTKTNTTNDGKCTTLIGGNLNECVFGRWFGIEVEDDEGKGIGFTKDHIYMKLRFYADIGIRQERGIYVCPDAVVRD